MQQQQQQSIVKQFCYFIDHFVSPNHNCHFINASLPDCLPFIRTIPHSEDVRLAFARTGYCQFTNFALADSTSGNTRSLHHHTLPHPRQTEAIMSSDPRY